MKINKVAEVMAGVLILASFAFPHAAFCENLSPDIIKITAPKESASGSYPHRSFRQFAVEGWACGDNLAPQIIHDIRTANLISEELVDKNQLLREGIQSLGLLMEESRQQGLNSNQLSENASRLSESILSRTAAVDLTLTDYQAHRTISARSMEEIDRYYIQKFHKEIEDFQKAAANGVNRLADTSAKFVGYETTLEQVMDNDETYVIVNCYTKSDLDVFVSNQTQAYQTAIALFDEYQKLRRDVEKYRKR
ncbi:MAG: hypothetical protein PHW80_03660 [Smithellaceae bacterium]|jgi:hypothetical protein|nr:hypothetical protein [Smithellaceae bacterium]MDD3257985.1 hypothetical protein [Smithellaceae bacterium]MDD3848377.1 hypothetical protein [Smithellaceae bacterium]HOG12101.1 hypothetical protein [Smithellaceae bacterium]HOQ71095.1 hypothetical protein [Smithellaceae bacterium]